jgi:hypothetical protein
VTYVCNNMNHNIFESEMVNERTITWHDYQTKFMLGWYIDLKRDQHATFKFKKTHHFQCSQALNRQFDMGVSVTQVDRHLRHYKENWKYIATALHKSGNSFDPIRCIVTISESEKAILKVRLLNISFCSDCPIFHFIQVVQIVEYFILFILISSFQ